MSDHSWTDDDLDAGSRSSEASCLSDSVYTITWSVALVAVVALLLAGTFTAAFAIGYNASEVETRRADYRPDMQVPPSDVALALRLGFGTRKSNGVQTRPDDRHSIDSDNNVANLVPHKIEARRETRDIIEWLQALEVTARSTALELPPANDRQSQSASGSDSSDSKPYFGRKATHTDETFDQMYWESCVADTRPLRMNADKWCSHFLATKLALEPIVAVTPVIGSDSKVQVVHLRLADGTQAIVRLLTQHERNVELVALKLDRVLGFYRSPVVVQRRVQVTELLILAAQSLSVEQVDSLRTALLTISNGDEAVLLVQALPTFAWQIVHEPSASSMWSLRAASKPSQVTTSKQHIEHLKLDSDAAERSAALEGVIDLMWQSFLFPALDGRFLSAPAPVLLLATNSTAPGPSVFLDNYRAQWGVGNSVGGPCVEPAQQACRFPRRVARRILALDAGQRGGAHDEQPLPIRLTTLASKVDLEPVGLVSVLLNSTQSFVLEAPSSSSDSDSASPKLADASLSLTCGMTNTISAVLSQWADAIRTCIEQHGERSVLFEDQWAPTTFVPFEELHRYWHTRDAAVHQADTNLHASKLAELVNARSVQGAPLQCGST